MVPEIGSLASRAMPQSDLVADTFTGLQDEFYPGSKRPRRESHEARVERVAEKRRVDKEAESWDSHPILRTYTDPKTGEKHYNKEFFPIGALAKALGRRSNTIRTWIRKGWLPKARYSTAPVEGTRGDAGRRLWTRSQIEGIMRIAQEEKLIGVWHPDVGGTQFPARVRAEYRTWP